MESNLVLNVPTVLVVGDFMVDHYLLATSTRQSAEAPIPIWDVYGEFDQPGGAGGVVTALLKLGAYAPALARAPYPIKTRIVVDGVQVARFDQQDRCKPINPSFINLESVDGVIVSDYGKGTITSEVVEALRPWTGPIFIDTKGDPEPWLHDHQGPRTLFPNLQEYERWEASYRKASQIILKRSGDGIARLTYTECVESYPAFTPPSLVKSVNGAGDTVIAAYAYATLTSQPYTPTFFANAAASLKVRLPYTATVTLDEILTYLPTLPSYGLQQNLSALHHLSSN